MKSCLYALLFLLSVSCSFAQSPVPDTNNRIKSGDSSYLIIDKCKIRGSAAISGTIVKNQELDPGGTPANYGEITIRNSRADSCYYYIDGVKVRCSSSLPETAGEQVTIITGGLPPDYGDSYCGCIIRINCPPKTPVPTSNKEQKMATE